MTTMTAELVGGPLDGERVEVADRFSASADDLVILHRFFDGPRVMNYVRNGRRAGDGTELLDYFHASPGEP